MNRIIIPTKDKKQQPVPHVWRKILSEMVEAFIDGDFKLSRTINGVQPVSADTAAAIEGNIQEYGISLAPLPEDTWSTSVCQWYGKYWDVMVDLYSTDEGISDLILQVRVYEGEEEYVFGVLSVYVP